MAKIGKDDLFRGDPINEIKAELEALLVVLKEVDKQLTEIGKERAKALQGA